MSASLAREDRRRRRANEVRQEIRKAAARLFFTKGYREVTMAEIGREVGLSPAALYYYYPNKAEILRAIDNECLERFDSLLASIAPRPEGLRRTIVDLFGMVYRFATESRDYFAFLTRMVSSVEPNLLEEITRRRLEKYLSARTHLIMIIEHFQASGEMRSDIPAEDLAMFLTGLVHSVMFAWFLGTLQDSEMPVIFERMSDLFLEGCKAPADGSRDGRAK